MTESSIFSESAQSSDTSHARKEGKRTKLATSHKIGSEEVQIIGGEWKFQKKPEFISARNTFWKTLYDA